MRTPKQIFLASAHRKSHEDWATTQSAEYSVMMALAQMESEMPESLSDVSKSWDYGAQRVGARRLAEILLSLHIPEPERKHTAFPTLPLPK